MQYYTFTLYVLVPDGPRLIRIKVCVPAHSGSREVGVSQEATLAVEGRAVPVKTRGEEDHDVRLLAASILYLLVGDFVEGQRGDLLPDFKGPPDGFK